MSKAHTVIHGLDELKKAEHKTAEYYNSAATTADQHSLADHAIVYRYIKAAHDSLALQIEGRKEELEKEDGESLVEELLENVVDALRAFVADLPTLFVQRETEPTPAVLKGLEHELIGQYQKLVDHADQATKELLNSAIASSKEHVDALEQMYG